MCVLNMIIIYHHCSKPLMETLNSDWDARVSIPVSVNNTNICTHHTKAKNRSSLIPYSLWISQIALDCAISIFTHKGTLQNTEEPFSSALLNGYFHTGHTGSGHSMRQLRDDDGMMRMACARCLKNVSRLRVAARCQKRQHRHHRI